MLLEKYIEDNSLRKFLSETLQSKVDAEEVLSIAKYNICTNQAFSWSGQWIEDHSKKLNYPITSQRVSELLKRITQSKIEGFLKKWVDSNINAKGYYCFDSTYADTGKMPMFHMNISISPCHARIKRFLD